MASEKNDRKKPLPDDVQEALAEAEAQRAIRDERVIAKLAQAADVSPRARQIMDEILKKRGFQQSRRAAPTANGAPKFNATPYNFVNPADIEPRRWIYGRSLIRKFVTVTVAPGGVGKSSLSIVEALAMVTGRPLLGKNVDEPLTVWMWNLEDPADELTRRIQAACEFYDIIGADLGGRLFVDSGRDQPLCIAVTNKNRTVIIKPVIEALEWEIQRRGIDVLIIDPFVSSHSVSENDNAAMDAVAKEWGKLADRTNTAIHLVHHTRKLGSDAEVTAESSRGGKALTDAAREVRAINRMSDDEGAKFGIRNHRSFFRMYSDKANMAPPAEISDWYEVKDVMLTNGDHVGVVASWTPPDAFEGVSADDLLRVQRRIHEGEWRENVKATNWAGFAVAEVLAIDAQATSGKARIKLLLKKWLENGALRIEIGKDEARRERQFVRVGVWAE